MVGNMYRDVKSINPLGGRCRINCRYCSSNNLRDRWLACMAKYSGPPKLYEQELRKFKKEHGAVFVCGQNDLFEELVPKSMIATIIEYINEHGNGANTYMFQSKQPHNMIQWCKDVHQPFVLWGTTIETDREDIVLSNAPPYWHRAKAMKELREMGCKTYITIEPVVEFTDEFWKFIRSAKPLLVYIGADSKKNDLPEPTKEQLEHLISKLQTIPDLKIKSNLGRLLA